jgi:hypothetical protein
MSWAYLLDNEPMNDKSKNGTNAWAYLNITRPVCAWAVYRGCLVPTPGEPGFISIWVSGRIREGHLGWLAVEQELEIVRRRFFADTRVSRLTGLFCFIDRASAVRAASWGRSFDPTYLNDLHIEGGVDAGRRTDANWISNYSDPACPRDWMQRYWQGEYSPFGEPIWEVVVDRRAWVLDTALRNRAFDLITKYMPDTVVILEKARMAAWIGSDLGSISCYLIRDGNYVEGRHLIDMRDASNPDFAGKLYDLRRSGHPVQPLAIAQGDAETFTVPDLRQLNFRIPIKDYPFRLVELP